MDPRAVKKARVRLRAIQRTIAELEECSDFEEFEALWYGFLTATKNIYTQLKLGAKGDPRSMQWFGGVQAARRGDDMLQYIFEARSDDEHGLESVAELVTGSLNIGVGKPGFSESFMLNSGPNGELLVTSNDGKPILIERHPPRFKLTPVRNRDGVTIYPPPSRHNGQPLSDNSPLNVAKLTFAHLSDIVEEADRRA